MNEVTKYFADAFRHMGGNRGVPVIEVRFYPYAGLRHTIRVRQGRVYVRLSDLCKDGPGVYSGSAVTREANSNDSRSGLSGLFTNTFSNAFI